MVEGQRLLTQFCDESAESCHPTHQLLYLLQVSWRFHVEDGLDLDGVSFDSSGKDEVSEYLASRDPEEAFLRVQLDLVAVEVVECLPKIIDEHGVVPGLDDDVVDLDLDVLADLVLEASVHAQLLGCACILQAEGHDVEAEDTVRCDKRGELLVLYFQLDLIIAGVSIEEGEALSTRCGVDELVNTWRPEVILRAVLVEASEVDARAHDWCVLL
jgi:hypothetical protein